MARTLILSVERVRRVVTRLAYEVVERNRGSSGLLLLGIERSGAVVAEHLAREISRIVDADVPVSGLNVTEYRDDRTPAGDAIASTGIDATQRDVLLVDDVLFTGRTARAALDAIVHLGRPRSIRLAVLVDRGHREIPIQPDFVGRLIQTKHQERVVVAVADGMAIYVDE